MNEWLENFLAAIGGGIVVLVSVFTIFKSLFIKLFETGIESSFEKNLEKFKNNLDRTTRAYEMLLDREMRFYEKLEPIIAELVPLEHDLLYFLKNNEPSDRKSHCKSFKDKFARYCDLTIILKNENLIHHSYIPMDIFKGVTDIVKQMQDDMPLWYEMAKRYFAGECEKIDYEKCETMISTLLMKIAFAESMIRHRLRQLSGEN